MGYRLKTPIMNRILTEWAKTHVIYAPKRLEGCGAFSDTDSIRYGEVTSVEEIEFTLKSQFTFKEFLTPLSQTLFFFTENEVKEADPPPRDAVIFLRSCDLHAARRQDAIYLENGPEDSYYRRIRDRVKFVVMSCPELFENCFCVDMGTNTVDGYDASLRLEGNEVLVENSNPDWDSLFRQAEVRETDDADVRPLFARRNAVRVSIPDDLHIGVMKSGVWTEYDSRCIACGRCNFSCPTCTCYSMQDIFYTDNGRAGERRRVAASCMVDGFTTVAGGGEYRRDYGQRMRFKVLHKVYDFKKRFGYQMCVGCGRCDDVCPEYISFSACINKLDGAIKEVAGSEK